MSTGAREAGPGTCSGANGGPAAPRPDDAGQPCAMHHAVRDCNDTMTHPMYRTPAPATGPVGGGMRAAQADVRHAASRAPVRPDRGT